MRALFFPPTEPLPLILLGIMLLHFYLMIVSGMHNITISSLPHQLSRSVHPPGLYDNDRSAGSNQYIVLSTTYLTTCTPPIILSKNCGVSSTTTTATATTTTTNKPIPNRIPLRNYPNSLNIKRRVGDLRIIHGGYTPTPRRKNLR